MRQDLGELERDGAGPTILSKIPRNQSNHKIGHMQIGKLSTLICLVVSALFIAKVAAGQVTSPAAVIHTVADLDRSVAFYRDVVGLETAGTKLFPSGGDRAIQSLTNVPHAQVKSATLGIPGSELHLVLVQFSGVEQKPVNSRIQDPGVVKLVVRVRDIDTAFSAVQKKGVSVYSTGGAPVRPEGPEQRVQAVIVKDPDGFALEFVLAAENIKTTAPANSNIVGGWASLVVDELDPTLKFYGETMGFKVNAKRQLPPSVLALEGTPEASVVNVGTRPPGSDFTWFIYDFRNIDRKALHSRLQDPGTSAVSFLVSDVSAFAEGLKQKGVPLESTGGASVDAGDSRAMFLRDPSGIPIELIQLKR